MSAAQTLKFNNFRPGGGGGGRGLLDKEYHCILLYGSFRKLGVPLKGSFRGLLKGSIRGL